VVGCEAIVSKLEKYQRLSQALQLNNINLKNFIPTNFVFKGSSVTGKTTTARKIAQVYYDRGLLSEPSVIECSASDLIKKYCGKSGPKTVKALERGLGKILFIDEAYWHANCSENNSFATEVVSELVDCLTNPKFFWKIIVILAG
jgi:AAA+ superfamily predicted ATPase